MIIFVQSGGLHAKVESPESSKNSETRMCVVRKNKP